MIEMTRIMLRVLCFVVATCVYGVGEFAIAQTEPINNENIKEYGLRNLENAVIIKATPANPSAAETVRLTAEGTVFDLSKDTVTWIINGKTVSSGIGKSEIDATINSKGDALDVVVTVFDPVWGSATNSIVLRPLQLDLLYDAPTYVPPFYRGRSLPTAGGTMRLHAIARFEQGGKIVPNSLITYTWSKNGTVLGKISGPGKSSVVLESPSLYSSDTISVRATAYDEALSASASLVIPNTPTRLQLYEDHPLFGVTYFNALPRQTRAQGEVSAAVIPYFAPVSSIRDSSLEFSWLWGSKTLTASTSKPNEVTLDADSESVNLQVEITSLINFFVDAKSTWTFLYGNSGGQTTKQGATDAFHNDDL
jgi:hypothetical protein